MRRTGFWAHVTETSAAMGKTLDAWEERKDRFSVTPTLVVLRILAGTDSPGPWLVPGASLHRELRHFVELWGMTPVEAIHAATGRAADTLGVDRGTIRPGNVADLLIVRGNAGNDIRALESVEQVVLGGVLYSRRTSRRRRRAGLPKISPRRSRNREPDRPSVAP